MLQKLLCAVMLSALLVALPALAAPAVTLGALTISAPWTTATPPGAPTATGYLTITNTGTVPDRLIAVSSPDAAMGMLHQMSVANGIASMHPINGIDIPAGKTVSLDPNGFHLMLVTLTETLKTGQTLPVTLTFEKAGKVDVVLDILPIGSKGPKSP
jgi:copper(I)-binding protein